MKPKILCIEDDKTIQTLVELALPDFQVLTATTLKDAAQAIRETQFSGILLDIQLPDGDGLRFIAERLGGEISKSTPVLVMSDHTEVSNKVLAFTLGAEDFIGKPFDPIELNARLTSKVRRFERDRQESQTRKIGNLVLDLDRQKAFLIESGSERDLGLTAVEMRVLNLLTRRLEQVYSREQIMQHVWPNTHISDRTVDSHIAHLRQKISATKLAIDTVKSVGYRAVLRHHD